MPEVGLILLAAGAATRMGQPKQLLEFRGQPLLRHCVGVALASACRPVVVVLGAAAEHLQPLLADLPVQVVLNDSWAAGMGSSIRAGLAAMESTKVSGLVLALADQPFVSHRTYNDLVECHLARGAALVASAYADTLGVPALFGRALFPELAQLSGQAGCKGVLLRHSRNVVVRSCPEAAFDLDTPEDYQRLVVTPGRHVESAPFPATD